MKIQAVIKPVNGDSIFTKKDRIAEFKLFEEEIASIRWPEYQKKMGWDVEFTNDMNLKIEAQKNVLNIASTYSIFNIDDPKEGNMVWTNSSSTNTFENRIMIFLGVIITLLIALYNFYFAFISIALFMLYKSIKNNFKSKYHSVLKSGSIEYEISKTVNQISLFEYPVTKIFLNQKLVAQWQQKSDSFHDLEIEEGMSERIVIACFFIGLLASEMQTTQRPIGY